MGRRGGENRLQELLAGEHETEGYAANTFDRVHHWRIHIGFACASRARKWGIQTGFELADNSKRNVFRIEDRSTSSSGARSAGSSFTRAGRCFRVGSGE